MKIYTTNHDIIAAAEKFYKKSHESSFGAKIFCFKDYEL